MRQGRRPSLPPVCQVYTNRRSRLRGPVHLTRRERKLGGMAIAIVFVSVFAACSELPDWPERIGVPAKPAYRNCAAARAAGDTPVYRGQPGYGEHLDRDADGIGCEWG